jgi:hypothetical protein
MPACIIDTLMTDVPSGIKAKKASRPEAFFVT